MFLVNDVIADESVQLGALTHKRGGFKMIQNDTRWIAWYSNAVMDLQNEYFPRDATDAFIARVDSKQLPMPDLWWFHVKGTKHGQAEWIGRIGLLTLAIGKFDNTPIAEKFKSYYRANEQRLSHGFFYDPRRFKGGAYNYYNTFEITTLSPGNEANPYTIFEVFDNMDEAKLKQLAAIVGDHDAELIAKNGVSASKQLADLGVRFKAMSEGTPVPVAPAATTPDPVAPATADKGLDTRITAVENTVLEGFKTLTGQLAEVLNPLGAVIKAQGEKQTATDTRLAQMETNIKAIAQFIRDEYAMQPPATTAQSTLLNPNDPAAQFMQAMQNGTQQAGAKQNAALGPFGDILGAIGMAGKSHQSPFEVPGSFGSQQAQLPPQQMLPQQPAAPAPYVSQQGMQLPQQGMQGNQPPPNMTGFIESILPNQGAGVGIPRLGN